MADRPITFSAPMVQALLAGRKTQTRRLAWRDPHEGGRGDGLERRASPWRKVQPGDRLWVREAWAPSDWATGDGKTCFYRADAYEDGTVPYLVSGTPSGGGVGNARIDRWHPSIHMPRRASRLTLTVTDARMERLQDISDRDALAEGVAWSEALGAYHVPGLPHPDPEFPVLCRPTAREMFAALWDTHGPGRWLANPEVVALSFIVEARNADA